MAYTYTLAQINEALETNADFEETASVTKAKAFITWANRWLLRNPDSSSNAGSAMTFGTRTVLELLKRAQAYVAANVDADSESSVSQVRFLATDTAWR